MARLTLQEKQANTPPRSPLLPANAGKRLCWSVTCLLFFKITSPLLMAVLLDWDQITMAPNAPAPGSSSSMTYETDASNPGNDVKLTLANAVGTWGSGYPVVSLNVYNGGDTTQKSLAFNFTSESNVNRGLTVTLDFSGYAHGVKNVSFQIFDVDFDASNSQWTDKIDQIWATTTAGGTLIGPNSVLGSEYNQISGSGIGYTATGVTGNAGPNSSLGNVTINFGTTAVNSVQFRWRNADKNRGDQKIALSDVSYLNATPTPEFGTSLGAVVACGIAAYGWRLRKPPSNLPPQA